MNSRSTTDPSTTPRPRLADPFAVPGVLRIAGYTPDECVEDLHVKPCHDCGAAVVFLLWAKHGRVCPGGDR